MQQRYPLPELAPQTLGFDMAAAMTRATLEAMSDYNRQMAKFVGHRLEMDAQLQSDLSRCESPFEALDCMARFWKVTLADYSGEAHRVRRLAVTTAERGVATLHTEFAREPAPVLD